MTVQADPAAGLDLVRDGAQREAGAARSALSAIEAALAGQPAGRAGERLFGVAALRPLLAAGGPVGRLAAGVLGSEARPVRAILFDKTPNANWALPWHQDRVIAVKARRDVPAFGPWTRKHGALHVAPPFELLAGMITLRVHLDPVHADNAPLLIACGSHRFGRVAEPDISSVVAQCATAACLAQPGDIWIYRTAILHASGRAQRPTRRRVLQVDYAATDLPGGLEWLGV